MGELAWLLPVVGCGIGMVLCMVVMGRMMGGDNKQPTERDDEIAALREEVRSLRAEQDRDSARTDG